MTDRIINNIKALGIDMIDNARSGHPGIVLSAGKILSLLYKDHLIINPKDPNWINRDRVVMSAGHGSALLYATLYMSGYDLKIDDLKQFRQLGSKTPGHPEINVTPGVDCSTGPLGQGVATAVGMAIGQKKLRIMNNIFKYRVYCLCGDGDLMEGISHEALSLAGTLNLDNLIILYDCNSVSLDSKTDVTFTEDIINRMKSYGFEIFEIKNGDNLKRINKIIEDAQKANKPSFIKINTIIGEGSVLQGTNEVHGKCLEQDDIDQLKDSLNIPNNKFFVDEQARNEMIKNINDRSLEKYNRWNKEFKNLISVDEELNKFISKKEEINLLNYDFNWNKNLEEATRVTNHKILNYISNNLNCIIGGSADLSSSTKAYIDNSGIVTADNFTPKNIYFGVREFAMGAIANGLALSGFRPFVSTFLTFSDYLKPAMRMSALMDLPVTYIFSHDSINVGPDGPTHQPIEQLAMIRIIPNMNLYRPADANELVGSWNEILAKNNPSSLILTRDNVPLLETTDSKEVSNGAYIVRKEEKLYATIIATGSEVSIAYKIANEIYDDYKVDIRVVSMPNMKEFLSKNKEYQEQIIPKGYRNIVIEAGSSALWHQFVYNNSYLITLDNFGVSGSKEDVLKHMNFDYQTIKKKIMDLLI